MLKDTPVFFIVFSRVRTGRGKMWVWRDGSLYHVIFSLSSLGKEKRRYHWDTQCSEFNCLQKTGFWKRAESIFSSMKVKSGKGKTKKKKKKTPNMHQVLVRQEKVMQTFSIEMIMQSFLKMVTKSSKAWNTQLRGQLHAEWVCTVHTQIGSLGRCFDFFILTICSYIKNSSEKKKRKERQRDLYD